MLHRIQQDLKDLMLIPGLSGHEQRVAKYIRNSLSELGVETSTDRLGNVIATFPGDEAAPSVMLFTHMDQLGFIVRKIDDDGFIRVERMGGVPERALASQAVLLCVRGGEDVPGIISNKAHHSTQPEEKYKVPKAAELSIDTGHNSAQSVRDAGIDIGTPVVYMPNYLELEGNRIAGTSVDDRAGCAVQLEVARELAKRAGGPTVHLVFSVQEEFNLRGAVVAAQNLKPDIAIQIDLMLASDNPGMEDRGEMKLGDGPGISLYSFHGRGTLNGVLPHPSMVNLFEGAAQSTGINLQRSAQVGVLTDLSYVQLLGEGVASIDVGFPMRYSHSSLEVCDLADLAGLTKLLLEAIGQVDENFSFSREE